MRMRNILAVIIPMLIAPPTVLAAQDDIEQFCTNIADAARERRYALKTRELEGLRKRIEKKMEALEKKRIELDAWVSKRDAFSKQAKSILVDIYAKMRPDAAAERLAILPESLAAAILMKLKPSQAGVILNEMKKVKAAAISAMIAASGAGSKS